MNPGDKVAIFMTGAGGADGAYSRLLLPNVQVIGAGTTTMVATTTTDARGAQTTDQLPKTLLTVAVTQPEAERLLFASSQRRALLRAAQRRLEGRRLQGRHRPQPVQG